MPQLDQFLVTPSSTLRDVLAVINANGEGIALVTDDRRHLISTVTDGDLRRAMLSGMDLAQPISEIIGNKSIHPGTDPVTAPAEMSDLDVVELMNRHSVRHVPRIASNGTLAGIALLSELSKQLELPLRAAVMAGGYGKRLLPLTAETPKPMLPIGARPLLEHTFKQLSDSGIRNINVLTHFQSEVITQHFGTGEDFGVDLQYVQEGEPLGTAGGLSLLEKSDQPLLVINGDIITQVNFKSLYRYHLEQKADMTVGVRPFEVQVPFGVVEMSESQVSAIREKPTMRYMVNAGVYLLEAAVCRALEPGAHCDMTGLIERLIGLGRKVVPFPIGEYWIDIGSASDYEKAKKESSTSATSVS